MNLENLNALESLIICAFTLKINSEKTGKIGHLLDCKIDESYFLKPLN